MKFIVTSGYFDPLHVGHIEYLQLARELGDRLVVIINNNHQATLKKGRALMPDMDRMKIIEALSCVDEVFLSVDTDTSVCRSLEAVWQSYPSTAEIIFAKGGDRTSDEIPEGPTCDRLNIKIVDGLGAKIHSSSSLEDALSYVMGKKMNKIPL